MSKYLDLAIVNEQIKTTNIKGKEYAEVNQRIKAFRMLYPSGVIKTELIRDENGECIFKAQVGYYINSENINWLGTGYAKEKEDSSFINKTSYIENCETSAVGRALGMAGFGIDVSVASAEEVLNAIENQKITKEDAEKYTLTFGKYKGKTIKEVYEQDKGYIEWWLGNTDKEDIKEMIKLTTGLEIPSPEDQKRILEMMSIILGLVDEKKVDLDQILEGYRVDSLTDLPLDKLNEIYLKLKEIK